MFELEKQDIARRITDICTELGLPEPKVQWAWIPFAGHWGIATSFFQLASEDVKRSGVKIPVPQRADEIAHLVAEKLGTPEGFERVEPVKGYLNLYFLPAEYTRKVVETVLARWRSFRRRRGQAFARDGRVLTTQHPQGFPCRSPAHAHAGRGRLEYFGIRRMGSRAGQLHRRHRPACDEVDVELPHPSQR